MGSSSVRPCVTPSTSACQSERRPGRSPTRSAASTTAIAKRPRAIPQTVHAEARRDSAAAAAGAASLTRLWPAAGRGVTKPPPPCAPGRAPLRLCGRAASRRIVPGPWGCRDGLRRRLPLRAGTKRTRPVAEECSNTGAVSEDWPSPHHHEPNPLPRVEDLPVAWEGYDRERVQAAFDAFYRHIAQLDSTLRTLEAVEVFRGQAVELRAELRSMRSAGWAPYPRGYTLTPERSMLGSVPDAVPRIALEVIFLIVVAAVVAVAEFSPFEIVAVMAGAALLVLLVELLAGRERGASMPIPAEAPMAASAPPPAEPARPIPAPPPSQAAVPAPDPNQPTTGELSLVPVPDLPQEEEAPVEEDVGGWAAFAEPAGEEAPKVMAALAVAEDGIPDEAEEAPAEEEEASLPFEPAAEAEPLPEPGPVADAEPEPTADVEPEPVAEVEPEPEP